MTTTRYTIEVDGARADQELARLHRSSTTLAGTEKTLETAVRGTNAALTQQAPAAAKAGAGMAGLQKRASSLAGVMGKQAAAIALVSQHLGEGNGKMGEAVKGAGMMAAAFGAGGPYAAALVAGIALIGQFNKHLERKIELQDQDIAKAFAVTDQIAVQRIETEKSIEALKRQIDTQRGANADIQAAQRAMHENNNRIIEAQKEIKRLGSRAENSEQSQQLQAEVKHRQGLNEKLETNLGLLKAVNEQKNKPPPGVKTPTAKTAEVIDEDNTFSGPSMNDLKKQWQEKQAEKLKVIEGNAQMEREAIGRRIEWEQRAEEENAAAIKAIREETAQHHADITMASASIISGASTQLLADLIGGQEKALERFGISIMAQAGQALVSYGVQGIGSGVLQTSLGNPAGLGQIAVGAGLVAAGVGLGGVAGGLSGLMGGSTETQRPLPGAMASPIGQQGGGTSFTIVYGGLSGPTAEQGAEALVGGQRLAERRNHSGGRDSR